MIETLRSIDVTYMWGEIVRLAQDPQANLKASLLLLAIIVITVLIVAVTVIATVSLVTSRPRRSKELEVLQQYLAMMEAEEGGDSVSIAEMERSVRPEVPVKERRPVGERLRDNIDAITNWAAVAIVGAVVLVVALGATTASPVMCTTCHATTTHSQAKKAQVSDPHGKVLCIRCHEPSGWLGSLTIEVPGRLLHMATGWQEGAKPAAYGVVTASACKGCHRAAIVKTTLDDARGVRMSHKEPIKAGAQCRDCHTLACKARQRAADSMHELAAREAHLQSILATIPEIAIINFSEKDVVRHPLVQKIVKAYDRADPHGFIQIDLSAYVGSGLVDAYKLTGNARASENVEIQPKGELCGDIVTTRLSMAEGGQFDGRSSMQKNIEIEFKPAES